MEEFKPVTFYSKIKDYVILMNDREVIYQGTKAIETKPTTKIKFVNGIYTAETKEIVKFLKGSKQFKVGKILLQPNSIKSALNPSPAVKFTKTMLMKFSQDEITGVAKSVGVVVEEGQTKSEIADAIIGKQKGSKKVVSTEKGTTANKGVVTNSVDPSIKVEKPTV